MPLSDPKKSAKDSPLVARLVVFTVLGVLAAFYAFEIYSR